MGQWPTIKLLHLEVDRAIWVGDLVGLEQPHRISIDYRLPPSAAVADSYFPTVRVLSPVLRLQPNAAEEAPLPHVYFESSNPLLSSLCLFDPEAGQWTHDDLIASTTVPWSADWLACYECWLATGRWLGGGRHRSDGLSK